MTEITHPLKVEKASTQSSLDVSDLFVEHPMPMALFTPDERLIAANATMRALSSCSPDYRAGQTFGEFMGEFERSLCESGHGSDQRQSVYPSGSKLADQIAQGDWRLPSLTNSEGAVLALRIFPLASGNFQLLVIELDQTDPTITSLREVMQHATDGFATFDRDGRLLACNSGFMGTVLNDPDMIPPVGLSRQELVEEVFRRGVLTTPDGQRTRDAARAVVARFFRSKKVETDIESPDGRVISFSSSPSENGGHIVSLRDVTDERSSEVEARTMLYDAVASLDEGFSLWDDDLRFLMCNDTYMKIVAPFRDEPFQAGTPAQLILQEAFRSGIYDIPEEVDEDTYVDGFLDWARSYSGPIEVIEKDGKTMVVSSKKTNLGGVLITARDITSLKKAKIAKVEATSDVIRSLDAGIVLFDQRLHYRFSNPRFLEMFIPGKAEPDENWSLSQMIKELARMGRLVLPDGMSSDGYAAFIVESTRTHARGVQMRMTDGTILEGSSHPSELGGYLLVFNDVSDRIAAAEEIERQRKIAFQNEKLSALGELLAGVAHELNNPLSIVVGYAQMLAAQIEDAAQADKLGRIATAAERSAKIVKTFLAMARQKPVRMEPIRIAEVIEDALDVAAYGLRSAGAQIVVRCPPDLPSVKADADQLVQVLSNLIVNAEHALQQRTDGAELRIEAQRIGRQVHLSVADNGTGIPRQVQERIFEPFFTTKEVGTGTGFGLAFCHRIIASHNGELSVESTPCKGSRFTITLPAISDEIEDRFEDEHEPLRSLRILVVDDETDVADLLKSLLEARGHRVVCAYGPSDALHEVFSQRFDIALSDIKMPGMMGDELYAKIVQHRPEMEGRIGFITGDSLSEKVRCFLEGGDQFFIEKPIQIEELLELVRKLGAPQGETT